MVMTRLLTERFEFHWFEAQPELQELWKFTSYFSAAGISYHNQTHPKEALFGLMTAEG